MKNLTFTFFFVGKRILRCLQETCNLWFDWIYNYVSDL